MENPSLALRSAVIMGIPMALFGGMGLQAMMSGFAPPPSATIEAALDAAVKAAGEARDEAKNAVQAVANARKDVLKMKDEVDAKVRQESLDIQGWIIGLSESLRDGWDKGFQELKEKIDELKTAVDRLKPPVPTSSDAPVLEVPMAPCQTAGGCSTDAKEPLKRNIEPRDRYLGLPHAAFEDHPTIVRLVSRNSLSPEESPDLDVTSHPLLEKEQPKARAFDFAAPARFTLARFGGEGEEFEEDAAVVYEGMRFVAAPNGVYEVRFMISTPAMPVTLRLQLHVPCELAGPHVVTLPPIELPPHVNSRGRFEAATWQVRHLGYSNILVRPEWNRKGDSSAEANYDGEGPYGEGSSFARHFPKLNDSGPLAIRRTGTARFGSRPISPY